MSSLTVSHPNCLKFGELGWQLGLQPSQPPHPNTTKRQLGWQTVQELIETETVKVVYRSIDHEAPEYLTGLLQRLCKTCARQLRNTSTDLYVPLLKTACGQKCFSYRGAKLWNDLKRESKMANTFNQFKSSLRNDKS